MNDEAKLDWYVFEESYLLKIDLNLCEAVLRIKVDARKSVTNPRLKEGGMFEDYFEEIEIMIKGVHYYRGVVNDNISLGTDNDLGDIYCLEIYDQCSKEDGLLLKNQNGFTEMLLINNNKTISINRTSQRELRFLEFVSEKISFRLAFNSFEISYHEQENECFSS